MTKNLGQIVGVFVILALLLGVAPGANQSAQAVSPNIVISQVYGGGNNSGATYQYDYIEIFNRGNTDVNVDGWSIQYASSTGTTWSSKTNLTGTIPAGGYLLVRGAGGATNGVALPVTPDIIGTINLSGTSGKVALVNSTTTLSVAACPTDSTIVDLVGYGSANCSETSPTPALSNTTAAKRNDNGCTDTDNNNSDFTAAAASSAPTPRNSTSPLNPCGSSDTAPSVTSVSPANAASGTAVNTNIVVTFSEDVTVTGAWYDLSCTASGSGLAATVSGGPRVYTIDPNADLQTSEACTFTVYAAQISDVDVIDPPDTMAANFVSTFDTYPVCDQPYTHIYSIQGSGLAPAITGVVTTQGVVVGDYEGPSPALRGFFLQDANGDGNAATSDGIFVFNGDNNSVALGDIVRVTGTADDYQDQTQISSVTSIVACGTGSVAPTDISLPFASSTEPEQYEGMLVRVPQTLYVTEIYQLGQYGQVTLSGTSRLPQPTNIAAPGAAAAAVLTANSLNKIVLDDTNNAQNADPIVFGRGGLPLSASNTLRGGDTVTGLTGVLNYTWGGATASPNAYRIRPVSPATSMPDFQPANPRPAATPSVGGTTKVVGMNLLNYFNTFDGLPDSVDNCALGVGGAPTDCRGADTADEFARQWPKTIAAMLTLDADVYGVVEMENDGYGSDSAIQDLVNHLNAATAPGTFAFINVDANTGQVNALGNDAIKVGLIYQPARVTPVGQTAVLNSIAFVNGGDAISRNRPSLLQAFQASATGETFLVSVNHLKSKGSACDGESVASDQGFCNTVRVNAVNELINWLATNPTGTGDPDVLIVGDLNSYAMEDPITTFTSHGYVNMVNAFGGAQAYSYVFDGQWGYLDHALASPSLYAQTTDVEDFHINSDEPSVLDYNTNYKSAGQIISLYSPDMYRISDHDPVVIGLNVNAVPFVKSIVRASASPTSSPSVNFYVYFSETVTGVDAADFVLTGIADAAITGISGSGSYRIVTVNTGTDNGTLRLDVIDNDTIIDNRGALLGGPGTGNGDFTSGQVYTIDKSTLTVTSIVRGSANPTSASSVTFYVYFNRSVTGVDAADFALTGIADAAITGISGSGSYRIVTVNTGTDNGTLRLDVIDNDTIVDTTGGLPLGGAGINNGDFTSGQVYTIDKSTLTVTSIVRGSANPTSASSVTFYVYFNRSVTSVDAADFALTGTADAAITGISGSGYYRIITVNTGTGSGTLRLDVIDNDTIVDTTGSLPLGGAGINNGDFTSGQVYTIDKSTLTVTSIVRGSANPTSASSVTFYVYFNRSVTGVDAADFALTGIADAAITGISGSGYYRIITVNTGTGSGTLRLDVIDNDTIVDTTGGLPLGGAGINNGDFTSGQVYTIDKSTLTVTSIVRGSANPTSASSVTFYVYFNRSVTGVDAADFALTGIADAAITGISGSGYYRIVTVNTGTGSGTLRLDVIDNDTIVDTTGGLPLGGAGINNGDFTSGQVYTIIR